MRKPTRWICFGLLLGLAWLWVLPSIASGSVAHAAAIGSIAAAIIAALLLRRISRPDAGTDAPSSADFNFVVAGYAAAIMLGLAASIWSSWTVARAAKAIANEAPYCIQVASQGDYAAARTWLDLSGLTMWADGSGGMRVQHHAILTVGNPQRLFHWSYHRRQFLPGAINETTPGYGPALYCEPRRDFADRLPFVIAEPSDATFVRFSNEQTFLIPASYRPVARGGNSALLMLAIHAPNFAPLQTSSVLARSSDQIVVDMRAPPLRPRVTSLSERFADQGTEHGLQKRLVTGRYKNGEEYRRNQYLIADPNFGDGALTTWIDCFPALDPFPASCQHWFIAEGRQHRFRHALEEVPRWREMHKMLLDLLTSWRTRAAEAGKSP